MDKITIYLLEEKQAKRKGGLYLEMVESVSYTHLTLPTIA